MRITPVLIAAALISTPFAQASASHHPWDGKTVYSKKCASCHGADGVAKPSAKGSANFNDPSFALTEDEIVKVTTDGKNKMPKYAGKLKPEEIKAVAAHIKTLAPAK
jgi:cytochrome c6